LEAVADRSGWKILKVYEDAGISGAKGRDQRPGLSEARKAASDRFRRLAAWRWTGLSSEKSSRVESINILWPIGSDEIQLGTSNFRSSPFLT
jgi:hypothetical protein